MSATRRHRRRISLEALESRQMMAGDSVHNFLAPHDVNDDHQFTPIDALLIINRLNDDSRSAGQVDDRLMLDVNDDQRTTPLDALQVINFLNRRSADDPVVPTGTLREVWLAGDAGSRAKIEYEVEANEAELQIRLQNAPANSTYDVTLNDLALGQLVTDDRGRGRIVLSDGDDNRQHLSLPDSFNGLTSDMHLVIGDLVDSLLADGIADDRGGNNNGGEDRGGDDNGGDDRGGNNNGGDDDGGINNNQGDHVVNLLATFPTINQIQRKAEYEVDVRRGVSVRKFKVEVEDARPGTEFTVKVGDQVITTAVADSKGKVKLILSSSPRDGRESQMPTDFPQIAAGTEITIGDATSTFQTRV